MYSEQDIISIDKNYFRDNLRSLARRLGVKQGRYKRELIINLLDSDKIHVEYGKIVINNLPTVNTMQSWFRIRDSINDNAFYGCMTKVTKFRKDIIFLLLETKIPFKTVNHTAGVYEILPK